MNLLGELRSMRRPALARGDAPAASPSTSAEDAVVALLGLWIVGAVYADGWAHLNLPGLESFFTPWHGALYLGFAVLSAWLGRMALLRRSADRPWYRAFPAGYGLSAAGVVVFGAGGVGDMAWHIVFGVEAAVDALVSPTHLVLLVGGILLITGPLRGVWHRTGGRWPRSLTAAWPGVLALATTAALAGFFLSYVSVFVQPMADQPLTTIPEGMPGHVESELPALVGLAGYLVTTAVLVVPLMLARRRGPLPPGSTAVVVALVALPAAALTELRYGVAATGAVAAALVADALVSTRGGPTDVRWVAVAVPALVWPGQLIGLAIMPGVRWSVELWFGVVVLTVLAGLALGSLAPPAKYRSIATSAR
jgi:hypothetical protein